MRQRVAQGKCACTRTERGPRHLRWRLPRPLQAVLLGLMGMLAIAAQAADPDDLEVDLVQTVHAATMDLSRTSYGAWRVKHTASGVEQIYPVFVDTGSVANGAPSNLIALKVDQGRYLVLDFNRLRIVRRDCPVQPLNSKTCTDAGVDEDSILSYHYRVPQSVGHIPNLDAIDTAFLPRDECYRRLSQQDWRHIKPCNGDPDGAGVDHFRVSQQSAGRLVLVQLTASGKSPDTVTLDFSEATAVVDRAGQATRIEPILDVRLAATDPGQLVVAISPDQAARSRVPVMFNSVNLSVYAAKVDTSGKTVLMMSETSRLLNDDRSRFVLEKKPGTTDQYYIRSVVSTAGAGGPGYLFQVPPSGATAIEEVKPGELKSDGSGALDDADRELRRVFKLSPDSSTTTLVNISSGTVLRNFDGRGAPLDFGSISGSGALNFTVSSLGSKTISVSLPPATHPAAGDPGDTALLESLSLYAITSNDTRLELTPSRGSWQLEPTPAIPGERTYQAPLPNLPDPAQTGALVKLAVKNNDTHHNITISEIQLRGRDLFECSCTLSGVDHQPIMLRSAARVNAGDTLSLDIDGSPSLSGASRRRHAAEVQAVIGIRSKLAERTVAWLEAGHELFDGLILTSRERPAFADFLLCYAAKFGPHGIRRDFIGDFLDLNGADPLESADIDAVFGELANPASACQASIPRDAQAYSTLDIQLGSLVQQRRRLRRMLAGADDVITEKYRIAEDARVRFQSIAAVEGTSAGGSSGAGGGISVTANAEAALAVLSVVPVVGEAAAIAGVGVSVVDTVTTDASEVAAASADQFDRHPKIEETSRQDLRNQIDIAIADTRDSLKTAESLEHDRLRATGQAMLADIPMIADFMRQLPDSPVTDSTKATKLAISEHAKWAIRGGVWKALLPLRVALIGRPLFTGREEYTPRRAADFPLDRVYPTWQPSDSEAFGYGPRFDADRAEFLSCLKDSTTCPTAQSRCRVIAADSPIDKDNFLFFSQTPPVRFNDLGIPSGGRVVTNAGDDSVAFLYPDGNFIDQGYRMLKGTDFWGWSLVTRPWNLAPPETDRSGDISAQKIAVDAITMSVRDIALQMADSPLEWYYAFRDAKELYQTRLYRNNLAGLPASALAGDSRPLYLSSVSVPVVSPAPADGSLAGKFGQLKLMSDDDFDEAWRDSIVPLGTFTPFQPDSHRWNPPYLERTTTSYINSTGGVGVPAKDNRIPSKAIVFQDRYYFWLKDPANVGKVMDLAPPPDPAPAPVELPAAR